ncbi:MAG TPA: UrcA family protein [Rhizomicrobium sp.]|jgi:UrcA family protein
MSISFRTTLLAGAVGLFLAAPATAQDYGYGYRQAAYESRPESVTVYAPHFRAETSRPLETPDKILLSQKIDMDDLDLRTRRGARELRHRVRETAHAVCEQLYAAYPHPELPGTHCYRDTVRTAMIRADHAIQNARYDAWHRY